MFIAFLVHLIVMFYSKYASKYLINCSFSHVIKASEDDKFEWIATLNCIIEGVPEKLIKRKTTYRARSKLV